MADPPQEVADMSSFSEEDDQVAVVNGGFPLFLNKKSKVPQVGHFEKEKQMFKMKMLQASKV
jgi:hypothetical protein